MRTAVFFMSSRLNIPGVDDKSIHVFDDDESARAFVFRKLIEAGLVRGDLSPADAVESVLDSFSPQEFFHLYPAVDHRTAEVTPAADDAIALGC